MNNIKVLWEGSLKQFVLMCNNCNSDSFYYEPNDDIFKMAREFYNRRHNNKYEFKNKLFERFYDLLLKNGAPVNYKFKQVRGLVVDINPFYPFKDDMPSKGVSNKWRILINILAYLDCSISRDVSLSNRYLVSPIDTIVVYKIENKSAIFLKMLNKDGKQLAKYSHPSLMKYIVNKVIKGKEV